MYISSWEVVTVTAYKIKFLLKFSYYSDVILYSCASCAQLDLHNNGINFKNPICFLIKNTDFLIITKLGFQQLLGISKQCHPFVLWCSLNRGNVSCVYIPIAVIRRWKQFVSIWDVDHNICVSLPSFPSQEWDLCMVTESAWLLRVKKMPLMVAVF